MSAAGVDDDDDLDCVRIISVAALCSWSISVKVDQGNMSSEGY